MKHFFTSIRNVFLIAITLLFSQTVFAQASACPAVDAGPDQTICSGNCVNLNAIVQGSVGTTSYTVSSIPYNPYAYTGGNPVLINIDDTWSNVIPLPFCFEFFGNTYNSMVIGSNAIITFDLTTANGYCQWPINAAIPTNQDPMNSIMAPWHDIDPSVATPTSATDVNWQVYGTAPCREMVVSWNDVAMFDCNNLIATSQLVLHESTNIIDVYIQDKPVCSTWNGGAAIEGIQDATGTNAYFVPGRNYPTQWTATNDGERFMPSGTPNYTVQWTDPNGVISTTNAVTVCPTTTTTYTATITNSSCSGPIVVNDAVTITVTNSLTTSTLSTPSSCSGNTGTATATASGGSGTYTYSWAPSGGTASTATGLASGSYTCTITDANTGCAVTATVNVANTGNLSASTTSTNILCNGGNNGTATVTPSGGSGIYTYSWAPSGGTAATASGLSNGTYTCTITDSNGCTNQQVVIITQPNAVTATSTVTNVTCNGGSNGSATVNPVGGSGVYTYSWAPSGGTAATASGLSDGTYTCTITDSNGCTGTASVTITQPTVLSETISVINIGCFSNGSATASPSGGTGPYSYSWSSGGNGQTETIFTAGNYTCTVTDANGCTTTQTCTVTNSSGLTATSNSTNINCFGNSNGTASVSPSGGSAPYTYSWSPSGGTSATATGLSAGTYTCTITDANGCTFTQTFNITSPAQLTSTTSNSNVSCNGGSDGSGTVTPSGGSPGYTYSWLPSGGTNATASGLTSGNYTITVTDANGCLITQNITVTQPNPLIATVPGDSVCMGMPSTISGLGSGGVSPYQYSWSNGPQTQSQTVSITSSTTYTLTVTDANGCTSTSSTTVTVNPLPTAAISSNAVNGVYQLTGTTGQLCFSGPVTGISSWQWNLNGASTSFAQNPCVTVSAADLGSYCASLIVTNTLGCSDSASTCVEISNVSYSIPNVFTPGADGANDNFMITSVGMKSLTCDIYNRWGQLIYSWAGTTGGWDGKTKSGNYAADGVYYYTAHLVDFTDKPYDESGFVELVKEK